MLTKMLRDATHPEETRVVVVRGNRVEELISTAQRQRGEIYLAKITQPSGALIHSFVASAGYSQPSNAASAMAIDT